MTDNLMATIDYSFRGFGNTNGSCHVTLGYSSDRKPIIICSQKHNYFGTSITNAAELIANDFIVDLVAKSISDSLFTPPGTQAPSNFRNFISQYWGKSVCNKRLVLGQLFRLSGLKWLEHYPAGTGIVSSDRFTEVVFSDSNIPEWLQPISADAARKIFGEVLINAAVAIGKNQ